MILLHVRPWLFVLVKKLHSLDLPYNIAALGYGITKIDLPDPTTNPNVKPRIVVFVDVGEASYQVSVVSFVKGKLVVKGTAYDRNLGGRNFDEVLVEHYIEEFKTKFKIDIGSNAKARHRLRAACEKVKKVRNKSHEF